MTIKENISKNLRKIRKEKKLNQRELAEKIGVQESTISAWEKNKNSIDIEMIYKICGVLEISISQLTEIKEELNLTKEELKLVEEYRELSEEGKEYINKDLKIAKELYKEQEEEFLKESNIY